MQFRNTFLAVAFGATSVAFAGTIESDLQQALKTQKGSIKVFAYLREQHSAKAAAILAPVYQGRIDDAVATLRDRAVAMRNLPSLSRKDEARFESTRPALFEAVALKPLTSNLDRLRGEFADAVTDMARSSSRLDFIRTRGKVESLGGTVEDETLVVSAIIAVVPANRVKELASWPEIASVGMEHETQRELDVSAQAMLATSFWSGGATGGPADVGVLDTGVQRNHAAFT
ncbi:MAG: hypothetical protein JNM34_04560, partial [Chthonomonadaceae bacterium]|nr:hypothetical protein [Chthonomonadaceae bacterium]